MTVIGGSTESVWEWTRRTHPPCGSATNARSAARLTSREPSRGFSSPITLLHLFRKLQVEKEERERELAEKQKQEEDAAPIGKQRKGTNSFSRGLDDVAAGKRKKAEKEEAKPTEVEAEKPKIRQEQVLDEVGVARQMILNYLGQRSRQQPGDATANMARQFHLCVWAQEEQEDSDLLEYLRSQWSPEAAPPSLDPSQPPAAVSLSAALLSRDGVIKITRQLTARRRLHKSYQGVLRRVLTALSEPQTQVRAKAMKALTTIVHADHAALSLPFVKAVIALRIDDPQTSVRDATLELVGGVVQLHLELLPDYFDILAKRFSDPGISVCPSPTTSCLLFPSHLLFQVRKRVVKLCAAICTTAPTHPLIPQLCLKLATRVHDPDESIQVYI